MSQPPAVSVFYGGRNNLMLTDDLPIALNDRKEDT